MRPFRNAWREKTSEAEENLLNQVRQYGFNSLEAAERHFTTHEE